MFDIHDNLQESALSSTNLLSSHFAPWLYLVEACCQEKEKNSHDSFSAITRTISLQVTCDRKDDIVCILIKCQSVNAEIKLLPFEPCNIWWLGSVWSLHHAQMVKIWWKYVHCPSIVHCQGSAEGWRQEAPFTSKNLTQEVVHTKHLTVAKTDLVTWD